MPICKRWRQAMRGMALAGGNGGQHQRLPLPPPDRWLMQNGASSRVIPFPATSSCRLGAQQTLYARRQTRISHPVPRVMKR
jgi:hypothetical protein